MYATCTDIKDEDGKKYEIGSKPNIRSAYQVKEYASKIR